MLPRPCTNLKTGVSSMYRSLGVPGHHQEVRRVAPPRGITQPQSPFAIAQVTQGFVNLYIYIGIEMSVYSTICQGQLRGLDPCVVGC